MALTQNNIGNLQGTQAWGEEYISSIGDPFRRDVLDALGIDYPEDFRIMQTDRYISQLFGTGEKTLVSGIKFEWFNLGRTAIPPINIGTAARCDADGTLNGSGAYVRANIATTSVYGSAGNYKSSGEKGGRVMILGNQNFEHFTIIKHEAPFANNTGHYLVLQLNINTTTTPAAVVTLLNGTSASLVWYTQVQNDLSDPTQTTMSRPSYYDAVIQQTARERVNVKQLDLQMLYFPVDGKPYYTSLLHMQWLAEVERDKTLQTLLGKRNTTASDNEQSLQTTDGLVDIARQNNDESGSLSLITSGNASDFFTAIDNLYDIGNGLNAAGTYAFLNGGVVQGAWEVGGTTALKNAGLMMSDDEKFTVAGHTSYLRDYSNRVAFQRKGMKFINLPCTVFDDSYYATPGDLGSLSLMMPVGTTRIYDFQASQTVSKPSLLNLTPVDSRGRLQKYIVNGPFEFGGVNPIQNGQNIQKLQVRRQFGLAVLAQAQIAAVQYS